MKKFIIFLVMSLPLVCLAEAYQSTLLVQTGKLRESDLIVRTVTDLESHKICQAFYVRTTGTSPVISCYDAVTGYASNVNQVGHFKEGQLVVRKIKDTVNDMSCLVAYVSTEGTSPSIDCYKSRQAGKDDMVRNGHLSEGDLDVYRVIDADSTKTCLVGYVSVLGTSPALTCYNSQPDGQGRPDAEQRVPGRRSHRAQDFRPGESHGVPGHLREHGRHLTVHLLLPDAGRPETGAGISVFNRG